MTFQVSWTLSSHLPPLIRALSSPPPATQCIIVNTLILKMLETGDHSKSKCDEWSQVVTMGLLKYLFVF